MKILVISSHYDRPGSFTGHPVHRLSRELVSHGADLRVLCPLARFQRPIVRGGIGRIMRAAWVSRLDGVRVSYLPYVNVPHGLSPGWDSRSLSHRLGVAYRSLNWQPDLIHAHQLFPTGDAAVRLARRLRRPVLVTAHGSDVHTYPQRSQRIALRTRYVVESADRITSVSDNLTSQIAELGNPVSQGLTVHLGVDTTRFRPQPHRSALRARLGLPGVGLGLISVCRLSRAKGVFEVIESFEAVLQEHPEAWLVLLGEGPARGELVEYVSSRRLQDSVYLPGAKPNEQVADWLNASDVFVLASHAEGLPNIVLEAMACGLPVVASDVGGTSEALAGGSGVLFRPRDVSGLTRVLLDLANAPELRDALGREALDRAKVEFSWERAASAYMALYSELLSS